MRLLFVLEVRSISDQEFAPRIGFADVEYLLGWIRKFLAEEAQQSIKDWRVVNYIPQNPIDAGTKPLLH